jgi:hypothetical protein
VQAEAGVPYILEGRDAGVVEVARGRQLVLRCESQGGRPAAELQWRRDGREVRELDSITEEVTRMGDNSGGWRTISTFSFRPEESTRITCLASSPATAVPRESSPLEVQVRGRPRVEVVVDQEVVKEGDSFEVICKSAAYPTDVAYRWFFSGAELEGITNNSILIEEISRMYDQADITCLVENEEGEGRGSTTLGVHFPPTLLLQPKSQVAKRKENVTFHCVASGNPSPSYVWTVGRQDSLLQGGTQNLSLVASEETEAVYRCHVFAEGHKLVSSLPASLTLIRRPEVRTDMERWARLGTDAILHCETRAVSSRTRLVWLKSGGSAAELEPLDLTSGRLEVITDWSDWLRTSDLLITNLTTADFGQYGCFAENEVGTDLGRIVLKHQSSVDSLTVAVVTACGLGVLLLLAVFLYFKLRRGAGDKELDPEK